MYRNAYGPSSRRAETEMFLRCVFKILFIGCCYMASLRYLLRFKRHRILGYTGLELYRHSYFESSKTLYQISHLIFFFKKITVCVRFIFEQFYDLVSVTTQLEGTESLKMTRIKKKKASSVKLPNMTLCQFLKMAKEGIW